MASQTRYRCDMVPVVGEMRAWNSVWGHSGNDQPLIVQGGGAARVTLQGWVDVVRAFTFFRQ